MNDPSSLISSPENTGNQTSITAGPNRLLRAILIFVIVSAALVIGIFALTSTRVVSGSQETDSSVDKSFSRIADALDNGTNITSYGSVRFGISAILPGRDWASPGEWSSHDGEYIWRADGKAHFGYTVKPSSDTPSDWVKSHQADPMTKRVQSTTEVIFKGYQAIRWEATMDYHSESLWREVFYVFSANGVTYAVMAGTTEDIWDNEGQELVSTVLDSIMIKQQTVVLNSVGTPTP